MYIYIDAGFEKINLICKGKQPLLPKRARSHVIAANTCVALGPRTARLTDLLLILFQFRGNVACAVQCPLIYTIHCFHNRVESHCVFDEYSVIGGFDCTHRVPSM